MLTKKKALFTGFFLFISGVFFLFSHINTKGFDRLGDDYFESSLKKAAVTYAVVRGVNSLVSVVKESHLDVTPAGVGMSIAVGEVLDPLDDMTERVSSVLVMAIVALGVEKIFFEIVNEFAFLLLSFLSLLIALTPFLPRSFSSKTYLFLLKGLVVILILRLLLPISASVSSYVNTTVFQEKIELSKGVLSKIDGSDFDMQVKRSNSFFEQLKGEYNALGNKVAQVKKSFYYLRNNMSEIISALITLITVYIFAFLLDVILLPFGLFYLIWKGVYAFRDV